MTTYPTGLIVGRFDPPHLGHSYLIDAAAERCERLVVYVNSRHSDAAPGRLRAAWLAKELFPDGWESPKPYIRIVKQPG